uniref:Variant surface glycoprotein 585 n=1 Tax=Trypanosoma brucei TaxID=5691 RepID=M4SXE7_9TRYP|nr:variant surface glycoprotein 585 [Trypanosoma brucei]
MSSKQHWPDDRNKIRALQSLALIAALTHRAVATSPAFKETSIEKLCSLGTTAAKAAGVALKKLNDLAKAEKAAQAAEQRLQVAAIYASTQDATTVFEAAATEAQVCAEGARRRLTDAIPKAIKAAAAGSKLSGHIDELVAILRQATAQDAARHCIAPTPDSDASSHKTANNKALGCEDTLAPEISEQGTIGNDNIDGDGFKQFNAVTNMLSSSATDDCSFLASENSGSKAKLWTTATAPKFIAGAITTTVTQPATATAQLQAAHKISENYEPKTSSDELAKVHQAVGGIETTETPPCPQTEGAVIDAVLDTNRLKTAIKARAGRLTEEERNNDTRVLEIIQAAAGKAQPTAKDLKEKMDQTQAKKLTGSSTTTVNLQTIQGTEELRSSLIIGIQELKAAAEAKSKCPAAQPNSGAKNSEGNTRDECSGKKGEACKGDCELVEGVCKPVKKGEGETKDKTGPANTTGSNSFVIHKAPVLLAFLLLE